jgi:tripartite-type tricarboxylate transporter receptor subunit TctC
MASPGKGTGPHIAGELFKTMTAVDMVHIPYRGMTPAYADLLGGQVQVMFPGPASSIGYIRGGQLRALAVTTATRFELLPDVPAVGDSCQATRRVHGSALARQKTLLLTLSIR